MNLLTSKWGLVVLALLIHAGVSGYLVFASLPKPIDPSQLPPERTEMPPRLWSFKTEAVDALIKELETEKAKLEEEKKTVVAMQVQIATDRAEVEKVRAEVKTMRDDFEGRVVEVQQDEAANLKGLSQTYSAMNPAAAVAIIREMDENMAVKIISMMKTAQISAILGEMGKTADKAGAGEDTLAKRAARISDKLRLTKPQKKPTTTAAN